MAVEIWPRVAPDHLKAAIETAERRELDWLIDELHETLTNLKHGLEDCYALLAPIDQGSTLVLSTPRNEVVKGHVTRVGTRIVKGTIHIRLRTLAPQTLTINPDHPIHLAPLTNLNTLLTHSIDLLTLTLSYSYPSATPTTPLPTDLPPPQFLSAQLRLLSQSLSEASSLLKGPPLPTADPTWTTRSVAPSHFIPPLPQPHINSTQPSLSFHLSIQDSSLVLWLRTLEPADAPLNFGAKLALAIGTARRLEHDESEKVFGFCCNHDHDTVGTGSSGGEGMQHQRGLVRAPSEGVNSFSSVLAAGGGNVGGGGSSGGLSATASSGGSVSSSTGSHTTTTATTTTTTAATAGGTAVPLSGTRSKKSVDVYVREKVRVESADPSLLSLSSKLTALSHTLALARRNLAAVLGEEVEGDEY